MIKIKHVIHLETVPKIIEDIINSNIQGLEDKKTNGWDVNAEIRLSKYTLLTPLSVAVLMEQFDSIKWLVENKTNVNEKKYTPFLDAVRYCNEDIIQYLVAHGANIHVISNVFSDAFLEAVWGNKTENILIIHELGHTVQKYGGFAFQQAVREMNYTATDFFIKHGVDINFNKPKVSDSSTTTPLCVAARDADLEMCKYLVKHGADVKLGENKGMRPYTIALEKGDHEMAEYFKALEPPEFHSLENKLIELKPFKLPQNLLNYLKGDSRRMEIENTDQIKFIEFFSLVDTVPMKVGRQKLLRISKVVDKFDLYPIDFVWNPKTKMIAAYDDNEQEELIDIAPFDEFMNDAKNLIETKLFYIIKE